MDDVQSGNWKIVQTKTFTKWVNSRLKKAGFPTIENLFTDLSSGVALANVLTAIGKQVVGYNLNPNSRIQKMENLTIILEYIKSLNISLVNIGPEDIVDGNQKLILGLIWTIISKLSISEILTSEFFTMREEILHWVQRVTEGYKNVNVVDLSTSWQDGLAFNAVIHKFRSALVPDFDSFNPANRYENCENAFRIAEEHLEIPRLFDPDDIIDVARPDEKSVLTYLSQFYQKFHPEEKQMATREKIKNVLKAINWSIEARNAYETRAAAFLEAKESMNKRAVALKSLLSTFVEELMKIRTTNTDLIAEAVDLRLLLNDIGDVHRLMCLKSYHPPDKYSCDKLTISYLNTMNLYDVAAVQNEVAEFCNTEAIELLKIAELSNELYSISEKELQLKEVTANESRFTPHNFCSESKQKAFDRIRAMFDAKNMKLKKFLTLKNVSDVLVSNAKKMFVTKDAKKTGTITVSDLKKILMALRFDMGIVEDVVGEMEGFVTCEKMIDIILKINYSKIARLGVQNALKESGYSDVVKLDELLPGDSLDGLKNIFGNDGNIEVKAILRLLED